MIRKDEPVRYLQNNRALTIATCSVFVITLKCLPLPRGSAVTTFLNSSRSSERDLYFFDSRLKSLENSSVSLKFIVIISYRVAFVAVKHAFIRKRLAVFSYPPRYVFV